MNAYDSQGRGRISKEAIGGKRFISRARRSDGSWGSAVANERLSLLINHNSCRAYYTFLSAYADGTHSHGIAILSFAYS